MSHCLLSHQTKGLHLSSDTLLLSPPVTLSHLHPAGLGTASSSCLLSCTGSCLLTCRAQPTACQGHLAGSPQSCRCVNCPESFFHDLLRNLAQFAPLQEEDDYAFLAKAESQLLDLMLAASAHPEDIGSALLEGAQGGLTGGEGGEEEGGYFKARGPPQEGGDFKARRPPPLLVPWDTSSHAGAHAGAHAVDPTVAHALRQAANIMRETVAKLEPLPARRGAPTKTPAPIPAGAGKLGAG